MEKRIVAVSERDARSLDDETPAGARRESGVLRVAEPSLPLPAQGESSFVAKSARAILSVVPARTTCWIMQGAGARAARGFSCDGERTLPICFSEHLSCLIDASPGTRSVRVDSQDGGPQFSFDAGDVFARCPSGDRAWLLLRDDDQGAVFGVVGLARASVEGRFTASERQNLADLVPLLACSLRAELSALDSKCELSLVHKLGSGHSTYLLFERDLERVVWASSAGAPVDWAGEIEPIEKLLARTIEQFLEAQSNDEILPTPPRLPLGIVVAAASLDDETPFGARCTAVGVQSPEEDRSPMGQLSARERAVVRLLVKGYEPANIAAITGIAEHTVRTYIRRAYKKLGVCRRADLVRRLLSPESGATCSGRR